MSKRQRGSLPPVAVQLVNRTARRVRERRDRKSAGETTCCGISDCLLHLMDGKAGEAAGSSSSSSPCASPSSGLGSTERQKEKARVSRTSLILWHAHQNDLAAVRKLLEEDPSLVNARDYDNRTPLHVASLHGWIEVARCLLDFKADVNAQDRWSNTVDALLLFRHHSISISFLLLTDAFRVSFLSAVGRRRRRQEEASDRAS